MVERLHKIKPKLFSLAPSSLSASSLIFQPQQPIPLFKHDKLIPASGALYLLRGNFLRSEQLSPQRLSFRSFLETLAALSRCSKNYFNNFLICLSPYLCSCVYFLFTLHRIMDKFLLAPCLELNLTHIMCSINIYRPTDSQGVYKEGSVRV